MAATSSPTDLSAEIFMAAAANRYRSLLSCRRRERARRVLNLVRPVETWQGNLDPLVRLSALAGEALGSAAYLRSLRSLTVPS